MIHILGHRTVSLKALPGRFLSAVCIARQKPICATLAASHSTAWPQHAAIRGASSFGASRRPATTGMSISEVDTPALLVDLAAFERNCNKLKAIMSEYPEVQVRPHIKTHKCAQLARLELELLGATGVCCQKVSEAEAMVAGGIKDVFVSNEVVTQSKVQRLVALQAAGAKVSVCVDSIIGIEMIKREAARLTPSGGWVGIVVEVNVGQDRCGVDGVDDAVRLAELAATLPNLEFKGVQAYHGGIQHVRDPKDRQAAVGAAVDRGRKFTEAIERAGLKCGVVTGGGSGTYHMDAASGFYNEVQPGSFCFGDADYGRNIQSDGSMGEWDQSLWVLATVMSSSEARSMVVLDAGIKAISLDSGPPLVPTRLTDGIQTEFQHGGDEHGKLLWPLGVHQLPTHLPSIGTQLTLQPGHCDPTVNMYDWIVAYRGDRVEGVLSIDGRGPGS